MKTFRKSILIFLLFLVGTVSLVHVDRQGAIIEGRKNDALTDAFVRVQERIR